MGVQDTPLKGIIYGLGFASGVYLGSILETYLAVGKVYIQAIIMREEASKVINAIRDEGYAVTVISANGKYKSRKVLMIFASRKNKNTIINMIHRLDDDALITVNEVSMVKGGYANSFRKIAK